MFVDDNFIAHKRAVRATAAGASCMAARNWIALRFLHGGLRSTPDDEALVRAMTGAGFASVFHRIETPSEEALRRDAQAPEHPQRISRRMFCGGDLGHSTYGPASFWVTTTTAGQLRAP